MSASSDGLTLRDAGPGDSAFIADMAVEAMNWNPERAPLSRDEILSTPALRHYFAGWPRPDDIGLVATDEHQRPIGAAWLRRFTSADPGYGYVDDAIPELSVGVEAGHRGRGVGRALLVALLERAAESGYPQVSLSVEKANYAINLYRRLGFLDHTDDGDAVTMLWSADRAGLRDGGQLGG